MAPFQTAGIAALCAALASVVALRLSRGIPLRWVGARAIVRSALGTFVVAFVVTAALVPALSLAALPLSEASPLAGSIGLLFGASLGLVVALQRRDERTALRLIEILPTSHAPASILGVLMPRLAELRRRERPGARCRALAIEVAAVRAMRLAGLRGPCSELAESIPEAELPEPLRDALRYDRALLRLRDGDYEGAEPLVDDALAGQRLSLRALTHALQGGADRALELLACSVPAEPEPRLIAGVARSHALASMGRDEETELLLQELVREYGVSAFTHLLRPVGPATDIARGLIGRNSSPPERR